MSASASPYNPDPEEKFDPERVRVLRYTMARAMAKDCASRPKPKGGPGSILVAMAGGKRRWAVFTDEGDYISVKLMNTEIMRFYQRTIEFKMAGFNRVTTRTVVNNLLPAGQVSGTGERPSGKKLFYRAPNMEEPMELPKHELTIRYSGYVVKDQEPAKGRGARDSEPVAA